MEGSEASDLLWTGEIRLTVLVPKEWQEEQFASIEEALEKLSVRFREMAEKLVPPLCRVQSQVV